MSDRFIDIQNVLQPGKSYRVDKAKFNAMRDALLKVAPASAPGATVNALREAVGVHLPEALFPGGKTAGWWLKAVQLDLEAKGELVRAQGAPVRLRLAV